MESQTIYTIDAILKSLGYPDPMVAARQQARMILLGRQARYQAAIKQLESKWGMTLSQMKQQYHQEGFEDFAADDDYLQWQWYVDAITVVESQLRTVTKE